MSKDTLKFRIETGICDAYADFSAEEGVEFGDIDCTVNMTEAEINKILIIPKKIRHHAFKMMFDEDSTMQLNDIRFHHLYPACVEAAVSWHLELKPEYNGDDIADSKEGHIDIYPEMLEHIEELNKLGFITRIKEETQTQKQEISMQAYA